MNEMIESLKGMSLYTSVIVFLATFLSDTLWAMYIRRTNLGKALSASLLSGVIVITAGIVAIEYVNNNWYLLPAAFGAFVGTFVTIYIDNKLHTRTPDPIHKITAV